MVYNLKNKKFKCSNLFISFLDLTKLKASADDNLNVGQMRISVCEGIKNILEKRRTCWLLAFSSFLLMFVTLPYAKSIIQSTLNLKFSNAFDIEKLNTAYAGELQ